MAAVGASALGVSLWQPWYRLELPPELFEQADALARQAGALGPLIEEGTQAARAAGPLDVTAWQAFESLDAVLLAMVVLAGAVALLGLFGMRLGSNGQDGTVLSMIGAAASVIVLVRMIDRPGPDGVLALGTGPWIALAGAALLAIGGAIAKGGHEARDLAAPVYTPMQSPPLSPGAGTGSRSVPPPR